MLKQYIFIILFLISKMAVSQSNQCHEELTKTQFAARFSLKLDSVNMELFKKELEEKIWQGKKFTHLATLPDKNGFINYDTNFPIFPTDRYTYFYPATDYSKYIPSEFQHNFKIPETGEIDVNLNELKEILSYVKADIIKNKNVTQYNYLLSEDLEGHASRSVYIMDEDNYVLGRAELFSGNQGYASHKNCNKINSVKIRYNETKENPKQISYLSLIDLKNNDYLPINGKKIYLKKNSVFDSKIKSCDFLMLMIDFALKNKGQIIARL